MSEGPRGGADSQDAGHKLVRLPEKGAAVTAPAEGLQVRGGGSGAAGERDCIEDRVQRIGVCAARGAGGRAAGQKLARLPKKG